MAKKIFISWSKPTSLMLAKEIKRILQDSFGYSVSVFISDIDIGYGDNWRDALSKKIKDADLGIIALTNENINQPWLLYEAGALSQKCTIIPVFYGNRETEGPLKDRQAVFSFSDKDNLSKFLHDVSKELKFKIEKKHFDNYILYEWSKSIKPGFLSDLKENQLVEGSTLTVDELKRSALYFADLGIEADMVIGINYGGSIMAPTYVYKKKTKPYISILHFKKEKNKLKAINQNLEIKDKKEFLLLDSKLKSGATLKKAIKIIMKATEGKKITIHVALSIIYLDNDNLPILKSKLDNTEEKNIFEIVENALTGGLKNEKKENITIKLHYRYFYQCKNPARLEKSDDPIKEELFQYLAH